MAYSFTVIKFAHNSLVNQSAGLSLFEIVTSYNSRKLIDLRPLPIGDRPSVSVESFAQHLSLYNQNLLANNN